ncbi:MAG: lipopolysaccharide biosynthesis protein RfbH, partial [Lachnospiraceae bacterium]|nr:lipopolysaccharide biosynthesis protein RfbH [Lachnospiraceae bacterium]
ATIEKKLVQLNKNVESILAGFENAKKQATIARNSYMESKNVQTRMLFAGNIIKQPCFDDIRNDGSKYRVIGDLKNTDRIMNDTFLVGVYPGLDEDRIKYMAKTIIESVSQ